MSDFYTIIEHYRTVARSKRDVGDRFEHLIKRYLLSYQVYDNDQIAQVWLWNEWPYKSQIGNHDTGIDLVALTTQGHWWAIQCKCQDATTEIDKPAVDSFLSTAGKTWLDDQQNQCLFKLCVFVSTTNQWSKHADNAFKNRTIGCFKINLADLEKSPVNWALLSKGETGNKVLSPPYLLRYHQQVALTKVHAYFKTNDRGKLIMACGTGKTLTALHIAEHEVSSKGFVLYLVPSIALLKQTFLEWRQHSQQVINFVWICSDPTTSQDNELYYDISELPWRATTDVHQIVTNLTTCLSKPGMTAVFSTYQSIDVVNKVQTMIKKSFDLIICDEAHRTTGVSLSKKVDESYFIKIHKQQFIQGTKRLYMTATPLIYNDILQQKLKANDCHFISMDNKTYYGDEIHRLSFGEAVAEDLLTDYKLIVATVDEHEVDQALLEFLLKDLTPLEKENPEIKQNTIKLLGCINTLKKNIVDHDPAKAEIGTDPMQRAVAFCNSIIDSKAITAFINIIRDYIKAKYPGTYVVSAQHMDGTMSTIERDKLLAWLKEDVDPLEGRVLTNVRCLNEGIDLPALDAIMFLSARSSKIDIVQSIGRVMRKWSTKKFGYIIIPVIVNDQSSGDKIFKTDNVKYKAVWSVMNALLAHDKTFDDEISKLIYTTGQATDRLIIGRASNDQLVISRVDEQGIINESIERFRNIIKGQTVAYRKNFLFQWVSEIGKVYEAYKTQINDALLINQTFKETFDQYYIFFKDLAYQANLSQASYIDMLAQHAVMKPVFQALFESTFSETNPVNKSLNDVLQQLINLVISDADQQKLDKFYESVKQKTSNVDSATNKQSLIMDIYHKLLKITSPKDIEKLGIVYTPMPIVDFIVKSVTDLLPIHFNTTINDHNVYIMDPFTGTGSFIVRLLENNLIDPAHLLHKYQHNIFANEITLLAYYVASINIINSFYYLKVPSVKGSFTNFWGMRFLDTFQIPKTNYHDWNHFYKTYYQSNKPIDANRPPISVIIGNPPYSVGQSSFNDQNQNTIYEELNQQIANTYVVQSSSRSIGSLYDSYYKAFRWSTDRLHPVGGGIISFVTNGGWLTSVSGAGFRKSIVKEYSIIYVINLRGNALTSGEVWRKEGGKIFDSGSRVSVAIVFLIKTTTLTNQPATIYYYAVDDYLKRQAKFDLLNNFQTVTNPNIPWMIIQPDDRGDWIDQVIKWPLNSIPFRPNVNTLTNVFNTDTRSFTTARDDWVINFDKLTLQNNVQITINFYEAERARLVDVIKTKKKNESLLFNADLLQISWSDALFNKLQSNKEIKYHASQVFKCQYRPFILNHIYFDSSLIERPSQQRHLFLTKPLMNRAIVVPTPGQKTPWSVFITNQLYGFSSVCFPEYTYQTNQDGTITTLHAINDQVLHKAQLLYNDPTITHTAIFDYLYGLLHHPIYQLQYQNNLQKDYPNLIWVTTKTTWWTISNIGRQLAELHLNFATLAPASIVDVIIKGKGDDLYKFTKMKYNQLTNTLIFNNYITITNLPININDYQVFGRSPLKWIIDYYQVSIV